MAATRSSPGSSTARNLHRPAIINVASRFAFLCPPGMAPYNLSKAAVVALSETLARRIEAARRRRHGRLPRPDADAVRRRCLVRQRHDFASSPNRTSAQSRLDPATVAAAALAASDRRELYVVMGTDQRWYWRLKRLMPRTLLTRVASRVRQRPRKQIFVRYRHTDHLPHAPPPIGNLARWLAQVDAHLDEILIDHAHCEKKAAGTALNLIFAYVEDQELCREMAFIVNEELEHFQMVLDLLNRRGIRFRRLKPSSYGRELNDLVRKQEPQRAVDRLLVAGLIEARSLRAIPRARRTRRRRRAGRRSTPACSSPKPATTPPTRASPNTSPRGSRDGPARRTRCARSRDHRPRRRTAPHAQLEATEYTGDRDQSNEHLRIATPASLRNLFPVASQNPGPRKSISPAGQCFAAGYRITTSSQNGFAVRIVGE